MKNLIMATLLTGTAMFAAQTATTPAAPAPATSGSTATTPKATAPAKKHHSKKSTTPSTSTSAQPATSKTPAK